MAEGRLEVHQGILVAPVSAVTFMSGEVLCLGVGPSFRIYHALTGEQLLAQDCLEEGARIHGIRLHAPLEVTLHGRKQVAVVSVADDYRSVQQALNLTTRDWTLEAKCLQHGPLVVGLAKRSWRCSNDESDDFCCDLFLIVNFKLTLA